MLLIVFIDECMKRTSFLLWDRISPSYREHFSMLMWHFLAYFWHTVRCNIPGPELQHFRYDRRRTDGDLTVIAGKMAKFLLQDNISPSSQQHFWGVYIRCIARFWHSITHYITPANRPQIWYDRRRSNRDLTAKSTVICVKSQSVKRLSWHTC